MNELIKKNMLKNEEYMSTYACKDKEAIRLYNYDEDIRPNYFRDIDRIIHSLSYTRYMDKTQVFSNNHNDNISKRIIHVQLVSKIARTIGRALNLNEDLIEAIALGHDIGHVPFGHVGESILNELSLKHDHTYFMHNIQSVRTLMFLENNGQGRNLTLQVLDGIMCHNGEFVSGKYEPRKKDENIFLKEYNACYTDSNIPKKLIPMTLEGCVVRISDIIGYLGRDIEDACMLKVFSKNDIPINISSILGSTNREIVNTIIMDIIENSYEKPYIKMSDEVYNSVLELKKFNFLNIYQKANSETEIKKYKMMFETLFEYYLNSLNNNTDSSICKVFLNDMSNKYLEETSNTRKVIDYIAGMTDAYFMDEYKKINKD